MLFKYAGEKRVYTLDDLMQVYKDNDYALEGSFYGWMEYEMEADDLIALENVPVEKALAFINQEAVEIRRQFKEIVADIMYDKVDEVLEEFQKRLNIWSGDVFPEESLELGRLTQELGGVIADIIIGESTDEFIVKAEGGLK